MSPREQTETSVDAETGGWWCTDGRWHRGPELIEWDSDFKDWEHAAGAAGFSIVAGWGSDSSILATVGLYGRGDGTYAVAINNIDGGEAAYAKSFPDAMNVIGQWAPALQALNAQHQDTVIGDGLVLAAGYLAQGDPSSDDGIAALVRLIVRAAK